MSRLVIAWISLVIGPVALLVFFVLQFLPYHSETISWWQRLLVVADVGILWVLWPQVVQTKEDPWTSAQAITGEQLLAVTMSVIPIALVFVVATFPGEWLDRHLPEVRFIPAKLLVRQGTSYLIEFRGGKLDAAARPYRLGSLHQLLVAGGIDHVARKPMSLWSNRIVLPGIDVIDHAKFDTEAKIASVSETLSLRDRRLEGAVLIAARLRKVDFTGAHLSGALLNGADLRDAKFDCDIREDQRICTQLQDAILDNAQLQGASLNGAQLHGASLTSAQLQGATLDDAQLQGASLDDAHLQGASLTNAQLQGASLNDARLQGASLDGASLQGASLRKASLVAASLNDARLQAASLREAKLQGAPYFLAHRSGPRC
jgi:uncharacterized protein YjbI with pentapeptide repeats